MKTPSFLKSSELKEAEKYLEEVKKIVETRNAKENSEAEFDAEIKPAGTGGHIIVPSKYVENPPRKARVIIYRKTDSQKEEESKK